MDPRTPIWPRIASGIDRITEGVGRALRWLLAAMVLIGALNAVARYLGRFTGANYSSNAYIELQWYLFSAVFLLGAAYALRHDVHVRVDPLYARLGPRGRAWIDLLGALFFLLPFSLLMLYVSYPSVAASWRVREMSPDPGGLPRYPIKALILVAFALLVAQGLAEMLRQIAVLQRTPPSAEAQPHRTEGE